jgi:hypothetical protein
MGHVQGLKKTTVAKDTPHEGAYPEPLQKAENQRSGDAYIKPPLFHWLFRPRGKLMAVLGPTLRSNISP